MTRLEALKELVAKVETGMFKANYSGPEHTAFPGMDEGNSYIRHHLRYAYHGSLGDAQALHNKVLPEWAYCDHIRRGLRFTSYIAKSVEDEPVNAVSNNPARAWLIAILKALISMEKTDD